MSKHTPGPWFISGSMKKYVEARIGGGLIQEVASCGPTGADDGYGEQQYANARLIVAAPDLLEALETLVNLVHEGRGLDHASKVARAAIAKARGEA